MYSVFRCCFCCLAIISSKRKVMDFCVHFDAYHYYFIILASLLLTTARYEVCSYVLRKVCIKNFCTMALGTYSITRFTANTYVTEDSFNDVLLFIPFRRVRADVGLKVSFVALYRQAIMIKFLGCITKSCTGDCRVLSASGVA